MREQFLILRLLQWGRGLSAAEGMLVFATDHRDMGLQWGRGLSAAEGRSMARSAWRTYALQWGRGLSAAEGLRRAPRAHPIPCFNGAAAFRPRKGQARLICGQQILASMGPRPFGRGREVERVDMPNHVLLQWGRGLSAAEGRMVIDHLDNNPRLQWGRGLSAAEGRKCLINDVRALGLQWGRGLSAAEGPCTCYMTILNC